MPSVLVGNHGDNKGYGKNSNKRNNDNCNDFDSNNGYSIYDN